MNKGTCFGVSVGPGDPKLITNKAIETIKKSDVIFLPSAPKENCRVYKIIKEALPEIDEDKYLAVETDGMANPETRGSRYDLLAERVAKFLEEGRDVAFPALGEVALFSTYMYICERLQEMGYECVNISGISSVQEAANRLMISLAQGNEEVHVFPSTDQLEQRLSMNGTKVFMKPKGDLEVTIDAICSYINNNPGTVAMGISNCGTKEEVIARNHTEIKKLSGYMTVIIVK